MFGSSGHVHQPPNVREYFVRSDNKTAAVGKYIVKASAAAKLTNHYPVGKTPKSLVNVPEANRNALQLNHYAILARERFRSVKTTRGSALAWSEGHRTMAYYYAQEDDETTARTLTWTIQELSNARSLANEGEAMGHCLSATAVKLSETSIWWAQVVDGDRLKRILTVAIESRVVTQARDRFNSNPDRESQGPAVNAGGGTRFKVKLDERYKYLMGRAHIILRQWLDRETIGYDHLDKYIA